MIKAALMGIVFLSIFALLFDRAYRYAMADERTDLFEDKWIRRIFVLFSALGLALFIHLLMFQHQGQQASSQAARRMPERTSSSSFPTAEATI
jgi:protein-S-isoprenylcysteine O-methyltransferase Ste14